MLALAGALVGAASSAATASTRHAGAPAPASFLVTLSGTITARSDSSVGQENGFSLNVSRRSVGYRWVETLRETLKSSGAVARRSDTLSGSGSSGIYLHMRHISYKDIEAACTMRLAPVRKDVTGADRLGITVDGATGGVTAGGLLPLDLVKASYGGPVSIGGFAAPCFNARPYDWAGTLGLPIQAKPKAAPFGPVSCDLTPTSPSCSRPFSLHETWPIANGSASLTVSARLTAKRLKPPHA